MQYVVKLVDNFLYIHFKLTSYFPSHISPQPVERRMYMVIILLKDIGIFSGMN